jgi:alginate O-acetyltransferase complex protein AlgI
MLFNSIEFLVFLPVVFALYWLAGRSTKTQNVLIVVASYFFYGWWDWRFLGIIALSSLLDYAVGLGLGRTQAPMARKALLATSLILNLGALAFFKYFNFFADSLARAFTFFGHPLSGPILVNVVLPVGISFYTFQTLSYSIDVYRGGLRPTKDIVAFFAFISFFPQLVAGPIERASNLLPQFEVRRAFDYGRAADGMRQILWGLFKKVVVADNCAIFVNGVFSHYGEHKASTLLAGGILFAFQIYGDFSGYSDIAIGTSRLFGFSLMRNFAYPYFSRDIAEFWRRWHISLSTWFRDYVYIPLGGSRGGRIQSIRNVWIVFTLSGLWHGANWTFVCWGIVNALYFLPSMLLHRNRIHTDTVAEGRVFPSATEFVQMCLTFLLTTLAWVLFRSATLRDAVAYLSRLVSPSIVSVPDGLSGKTLAFVCLLIVVEWVQRTKQHALEFDAGKPRIATRWAIYLFLTYLMIVHGAHEQQFIYFQF